MKITQSHVHIFCTLVLRQTQRATLSISLKSKAGPTDGAAIGSTSLKNILHKKDVFTD